MKKKVFVFSFIFLIACSKTDKSIELLNNAVSNFNDIEVKHDIQLEILTILEQFYKSETVKLKQVNTIITLTDKNGILIFKDGKLTDIKKDNQVYKISDVNKIGITYNIGNVAKTGSLESGVYDGVHIRALKNGSISEVIFSKGDSLQLKEVYKNGNLKKKVDYISGLRDGVYAEFHVNNTKKVECEYLKGIKEGVYQEWFDTGKQKTKVLYQNGKKEGKQLFYFKDTQTMEFNNFYKNGHKEGLQIAWDENAKTKYKVYYKAGKLNGEAIVYQENSSLMKMKGKYVDDSRNGSFIIYNNKGQVYFSANYSYNELDTILVGTNEGEVKLYDLEVAFY